MNPLSKYGIGALRSAASNWKSGSGLAGTLRSLGITQAQVNNYIYNQDMLSFTQTGKFGAKASPNTDMNASMKRFGESVKKAFTGKMEPATSQGLKNVIKTAQEKPQGSFSWQQDPAKAPIRHDAMRNYDWKKTGEYVWDPNAESSGIPPEALRSILKEGALPIEQQVIKNLQTLTGGTAAEVEQLILNNSGLEDLISKGVQQINSGDRGWGKTSLSKGEVNEYLNQSMKQSGDIQEKYPQINIEDTYRTEFKKGGTYKRKEGGAIKNIKPTGRIPMGGMTSAFRFDWKNKK